eukprot:Amastigsp_a919_75.p3 type:complete len:114 gc:universal Amastigsp_a919_75:234-575(+)
MPRKSLCASHSCTRSSITFPSGGATTSGSRILSRQGMIAAATAATRTIAEWPSTARFCGAGKLRFGLSCLRRCASSLRSSSLTTFTSIASTKSADARCSRPSRFAKPSRAWRG